MSLQNAEHGYVCLSFEEVNILVVNYRRQDLAGLIARMDNLLSHTADPLLRRDLESLIRKLQNLTPEEYKLLAKDLEQGKVVFPANYPLPHIR